MLLSDITPTAEASGNSGAAQEALQRIMYKGKPMHKDSDTGLWMDEDGNYAAPGFDPLQKENGGSWIDQAMIWIRDHLNPNPGVTDDGNTATGKAQRQ